MPVVLALDFPPSAVSPNKRKSWESIRAKTAYRLACKLAALNIRRAYEAQGVRFPLVPPVSMRVTFLLPDGRRRDADNLIASFKAGQDGALCDAGLLDDDSVAVIASLAYDWRRGAKPGGVRVELEEAE